MPDISCSIWTVRHESTSPSHSKQVQGGQKRGFSHFTHHIGIIISLLYTETEQWKISQHKASYSQQRSRSDAPHRCIPINDHCQPPSLDLAVLTITPTIYECNPFQYLHQCLAHYWNTSALTTCPSRQPCDWSVSPSLRILPK